MFFKDFDFYDFWETDCPHEDRYISAEEVTPQLISRTENYLGYKLPRSYVWLMTQHNGGTPVKTACPCDVPTSWADDHVAISGIFGIGSEKDNSLCGRFGSRFWIEEWEYPDIGVAICDCPSAGHDMIFLDYRQCGPQGEPCVVHVDQEADYEITFLAENFEEFVKILASEDEYEY